MITAVVMPQMGLEVTEGSVSSLLVEVGTRVAQDDALLELETDKATTDVVAPRDGVVRAWAVEVGQTVPVGATLVYLADDPDEPLDGDGATPSPSASALAAPVAEVRGPEAPAAPAGNGRLRAAPVARRAAERLGIALERIDGTGPRGRITLRDVERAAAERAEGAAADRSRTGAGGAAADRSRSGAGGTADERPGGATAELAGGAAAARSDGAAAGAVAAADLPLTGELVTERPSALRRAVARRMTQSQAIPQYQLEREVDATHLLAQRVALAAAAEGPRPGVNDLLVQAIAETVVRHPLLATAWLEREPDGPLLARRTEIGVGLAVATERGLVVPVLRDVPRCGIAALAAQRRELVAAARAGRLALEQMEGGAITLSSLAGFGIARFSAMVNPGQSAIVAAGQVVDRVVPRGRSLTIVPTLTLTASFDHRVVDGAAGAEALETLVALLEGAMTWRP